MPTAKLPPISPTRQSKTLAGGASRTTARSPTAQLPAQPLPGIAATSTLPLETMVVQQYCMSLMSQGYVRSYSELFELTHDVSPVWLHREAATNSKVESSTNGDGEGTVAELDHPVAKCKRADDAADYADIPSLLSIMYTFVTLTTLHVKDTAKTVLPADRAERQRVLETIENATPRKSSYTVRTLSEIKALLMAAESASWSGDFTRIYQAET